MRCTSADASHSPLVFRLLEIRRPTARVSRVRGVRSAWDETRHVPAGIFRKRLHHVAVRVERDRDRRMTK
jgi:hypothetical protein